MSLNQDHYGNYLGQSSSAALKHYIGMGKLPVQNPLSACPGLTTQSLYEAPGELRFEPVIKAWCLTLGLLRLLSLQSPEVGLGQHPNSL